jgi:hypothetical protein
MSRSLPERTLVTDHSPYPIPSYALNAWLAGDKIHINFPPTDGHSRSHSVVLPADERGMKVLLALMKERQQAEYTLTVATAAAPVQYDVDAILRAMGNTQAPKITKVPPKHKMLAPENLTLEDLL